MKKTTKKKQEKSTKKDNKVIWQHETLYKDANFKSIFTIINDKNEPFIKEEFKTNGSK